MAQYVCATLGLRDLADTELLDVGCGTKFTEAFLNDGLAIKRYVGVDVYGEMVEFLQESADDPRFEYFHLDVRNELYNPDAPPMTPTRISESGTARSISSGCSRCSPTSTQKTSAA